MTLWAKVKAWVNSSGFWTIDPPAPEAEPTPPYLVTEDKPLSLGDFEGYDKIQASGSQAERDLEIITQFCEVCSTPATIKKKRTRKPRPRKRPAK